MVSVVAVEFTSILKFAFAWLHLRTLPLYLSSFIRLIQN